MNPFGLQFHSNSPIYLQLAEHIRRAIASGQLACGQRLDSVRDLASAYQVNPNTMQRALSTLESEGLLRSERTAGRFITEDTELIAALQVCEADAIIAQFLEQMQQIGCERQRILTLVQSAVEAAEKGESHGTQQ